MVNCLNPGIGYVLFFCPFTKTRYNLYHGYSMTTTGEQGCKNAHAMSALFKPPKIQYNLSICKSNWLQADADAFLALVKEVNEASPAKQEELSEDLMRTFAYNAQGDVCPMQAVIGGITAQEVMKVGVNAHTVI